MFSRPALIKSLGGFILLIGCAYYSLGDVWAGYPDYFWRIVDQFSSMTFEVGDHSTAQTKMHFLSSGQVGVGTLPSNESVLLEIKGEDKALQMPQVSSVSVIPSPRPGMMVYDASEGCFKVFEGADWSFCFQVGTQITLATQAPSDPVPGSLYMESSTDQAQLYDGQTWQTLRNDVLVVSTQTPITPSPQAGDLWFNPETALLSIFRQSYWKPLGADIGTLISKQTACTFEAACSEHQFTTQIDTAGGPPQNKACCQITFSSEPYWAIGDWGACTDYRQLRTVICTDPATKTSLDDQVCQDSGRLRPSLSQPCVGSQGWATLDFEIKGLSPFSGSVIRAGDRVTYEIKIRNNTAQPVEDLVVTDPAEEGFVFIDPADGKARFENGSVILELGALEAGATLTYQYAWELTSQAQIGTLDNVLSLGLGDGSSQLSNAARYHVLQSSFESPTGSDPEALTCGDLVRDPSEACDDGNLLDGDGCNAFCGLESFLCPSGDRKIKTSQCFTQSPLRVDLEVDFPREVMEVRREDPIDYQLLIENPQAFRVEDIEIKATVDAGVTFDLKSGEGTLDQTAEGITIQAGSFAPGETKAFTYDLVVGDQAVFGVYDHRPYIHGSILGGPVWYQATDNSLSEVVPYTPPSCYTTRYTSPYLIPRTMSYGETDALGFGTPAYHLVRTAFAPGSILSLVDMGPTDGESAAYSESCLSGGWKLDFVDGSGQRLGTHTLDDDGLGFVPQGVSIPSGTQALYVGFDDPDDNYQHNTTDRACSFVFAIDNCADVSEATFELGTSCEGLKRMGFTQHQEYLLDPDGDGPKLPEIQYCKMDRLGDIDGIYTQMRKLSGGEDFVIDHIGTNTKLSIRNIAGNLRYRTQNTQTAYLNDCATAQVHRTTTGLPVVGSEDLWFVELQNQDGIALVRIPLSDFVANPTYDLPENMTQIRIVSSSEATFGITPSDGWDGWTSDGYCRFDVEFLE